MPSERTVVVPRSRLRRWLDNFSTRHGEPAVTLADQVLTLRAPDGAQARCLLPADAIPTTADPASPLDVDPASPLDVDPASPLDVDPASPLDVDPASPLDVDPASPLDAVVAHLVRDRWIAVILARRGGHAIGVFDGDRLVRSKVGRRYVQGRTKAGGWSQQRYARRRAQQARQAWHEAADDAAAVLLGHDDAYDTLLCGGDREACTGILTDPRLADLAAAWDPRVVHPVPDPRLRVLTGFLDQATGVRIELNDLA